MKLICAPKGYKFKGNSERWRLSFTDTPTGPHGKLPGAAITDEIVDCNLHPAPRAWDFLSLVLAVTAADLAVIEPRAPTDGHANSNWKLLSPIPHSGISNASWSAAFSGF